MATVNRTGKTNAKKGVDDYNAYREFHDREVEGHLIAAFVVFCGMENMEGMFLYVPLGYMPIWTLKVLCSHHNYH